MEFRAPPEQFGLPHEMGEEIWRLYVEEQKTIIETTAMLSRKAGRPVSKHRVGKFVKANGWSRSPSHYAKKSPFHGLTRVSLEASKAIKKRRGEWVD